MTLFEKYGGVPTVSRIVSAFYRDVLSRPTLAQYFEGIDKLRLIDHQVAFISHVLGQPASVYEGRALGTAHMAVGITDDAFTEVAQVLRSTLEDAAMAPGDIDAVMAVVADTRAAIVTR
jgi:hemoglobin